MGKGLQLALAVVSVFAGLAWFVGSQSEGDGSFRYYRTVDEFVAAADSAGGRGSRVHGFVLEGSIHRDLPAGYVEFVIRDEHDGVLSVRYDGIDVPDLFGDGAELVVEGRLSGQVFVADRMMAKCPSKYEARDEPGREV